MSDTPSDNLLLALKLLARLRWNTPALRVITQTANGLQQPFTMDGAAVHELIEKILDGTDRNFQKNFWKAFDETKGFSDVILEIRGQK